jgi:hypothetical protein
MGKNRQGRAAQKGCWLIEYPVFVA